MTRVFNKNSFRSTGLNRAPRLTLLLAGLAGLAGLAAAAQAAALPQPIKVETGLVQGSAVTADGVQSFKGIPYAAPPSGELRWRPPAPALPWSGVLHADHFAADCPTSMPLPESTAGSQSEDCLYLNLWTPARKPSAKLPVMVWIYGSGFQGASASYRRYDGEALAREGVVLVSFDYRNGILGFMTHPLLTAESAHHVSGNYGLLDVLAALEWVKRNIAAFGGDPSRVTIFGQSSGSETVNLMTASPLASGLFQRAIGESGGAFGQRETGTLADVEPQGRAFSEKLGAKTLAELRAKTTEELFAAKPPRFEPVIDGWVLPADVHAIYAAGRQNDVPTLVGSNADESQLSNTLTASQFESQARDRYGARAIDFLRLFPATTDEEARGSAKASGTLLFGDYNSTTWARLQARSGKARIYQYRFVHVPPKSPESAGPPRDGAYHGAEIPYVFHNLYLEPRPWSAIDLRLEAQLSSYWVNFARTGDPNGEGLPHWPSVQADPGEVLQLADAPQLIERPNTTQVDFFERLFYERGGLYAAATQDAGACEALRHFDSRGVEIVAAVRQTAGPFKPSAPPAGAAAPIDLPTHCLVSGVIERRTGADGKAYGIHFEMRLPDHWNGRFLFQGGGGTNGVVRPAIGQVKGPAALLSGFAVVTQDAGHEGPDSSFGADQQARIDMIYRSYERVTDIAKSLIAAYYGKPPTYSYFMGCSEGGREALLASQRMPLEYDGVVAGDPGFLLGVRFQSEVDRLALAPLAPLKAGKRDYSHTFSATDLRLVADTITADCDASDGARDGIIEHWSGCKPKLARLLCKRGKSESCLSAAQLAVLDQIYAGTPSLTPGYPYDTGISQPAWQDKLAGGGRLGGGGVSSVQGLFLTPYDPTYDDEKLDMDRDAARFEEVGSLNRADGVMYSTFKQRGAKLLIYTGLSDFAFSAKDLIAYYQRLAAANGGLDATQAFARLFLVPGMTHCRGGRALDDFDPLSAVVAWVEGHQAPQRLLATGQSFPGRTRPLCPYPAESIYGGTGSLDTAANFACKIPAPQAR